MAKSNASTEIAVRKDPLTLFEERGGLTKVTGPSDTPDFLREDAPSKEERQELARYIRPPRLKVVQPMSKGEVADQFAPGACVVMPHMVQVTGLSIDDKTQRPRDEGDPFHFVPLHFWTEWCLWNPLDLKGKEPSVVESTMEYDSQLAAKARDPKLRMELIPGISGEGGKPLYRRAVEHFNFLFLTLDVEAVHGLPFVVSFSKGEHKVGTSLCTMIQMRKARGCGCVFQAKVKKRENEKGKWYGLEVNNPAEGLPRFVQSSEMYGTFRELFEQTKAAVDSRRVKVDYDDPTEQEPQPVADGEFV